MVNLINDLINAVATWLEGLSSDDYIKWTIIILKIIFIFLLSRIIIKLGAAVITGFFNRRSNKHFVINEKKANTLGKLAISVLRYIIYFIAFVNIMSILGFGVTAQSILATAGIGGLAIGFGAQSLVKDIITGFFILFEDQYSVGDFVTIGDITGTIEDIGVRITRVRGFKGDLTIIPNGQISKVTNYSRGNSVAIVDINISLDENIDKALAIMEETAIEFALGNTDIVEQPQALGVMGFDNSEVNIRLIARTLPLKHWGVERELRKKIKQAFDANGIEIPYPKRVMLEKKH